MSVIGQNNAAQRWAARPVAGFAVRAVVVLAPLAGAFLFVQLASNWVRPPTNSLWLYLAWWFGLSAAATVVLFAVDRVARRLLPLSALLNLSLAFPDETPSRLRTALRSGGVDTLEKRLALVDEVKSARTPDESAALLLRLVSTLNEHDRLTRGHSERVRAYARLIGEELGLDEEELDLLNWGALLHDIGKLGVPPEILTKDHAPSSEEWKILRKHPLYGEELTEPLAHWLAAWHSAVGSHHERWDGNGYPRGLSGEEIPQAARIVAVADTFDVITSARSYKEAGSSADGRAEIARCAGTQFDPRVVRAFLNVSLGRMRFVMGPLSWLTHAPILGRLPFTPAIGTIASTLGVVATASASGALSHPPATPVHPPSMRAAATATPVTPKPFVVRPKAERAVARPHKAPGERSVSKPGLSKKAGAARPAAASPSSASPKSLSKATPSDDKTTSAASHARETLVFTVQPQANARVHLGVPIVLTVAVQDHYGNRMTTDVETRVRIALAANPGGSKLRCTNPGGAGPVAARSGIASFTCALTALGDGYSFSAASGGDGVDPMRVTSNRFDVVAPRIIVSPPTLPAATVGEPYKQRLEVSGGTKPHRFRLAGGALPRGLSLNPTGKVIGAPTAAGISSFTVVATDRYGSTGSLAVRLNVVEPEAAPSKTTPPKTAPPPVATVSLPTATVGQSYEENLKPSSGFDLKLNGGTLPPGLTLAGDGKLKGTPTAAGSFVFTIAATDKGGATSSVRYSLTVVAPTITLSPSSLPGATLGQSYSEELKADGGAGGYAYTIGGGALPPGITLADDGKVKGTPTAAGSFTFTVTATDKNRATGSKPFRLTVAAPQITLSPSTLPAATVGKSYDERVKASGGDGGYMYTLGGGALPPGMTLADDGKVKGTPTAAGSFTFTVTATDKNGATGSQNVTLTVN